MKSLRCLIAAAALAFMVPAQAGINDPEVILYRVSGVVDVNSGWATIFFCTNFSGVTETLRVVVRSPSAALMANVPVSIAHLNSVALATRPVTLFNHTNMNTDTVNPGTAAIAATSVNITCTATQVQTNTTVPLTVPLHMTRFNPIAGTQE